MSKITALSLRFQLFFTPVEYTIHVDVEICHSIRTTFSVLHLEFIQLIVITDVITV